MANSTLLAVGYTMSGVTPSEPTAKPLVVTPLPDDHVHDDDCAEVHEQHAVMKVRLARLELLLGMGHSAAGSAAHHLPAWLRPTKGETRWTVTLAVIVLVALQWKVPGKYTFQPKFLVLSLEGLMFAALVAANPVRITRESLWVRALGLSLVGLTSLMTAWSAVRLVYALANGRGGTNAMALLLDGGGIWLTNVLVFALWYWEVDRGGPAARAKARNKYPDFLFSQMTTPELVPRDWEPAFVDYLYLSFTNATAFSPTDTLPLTRWAKLMMMFQSGISLVTVALVVARAVNIFT
jgi:uncharacterized membrane protein